MNSYWNQHFKAFTSKAMAPAVTLQMAIKLFNQEHLSENAKTAIDLGCGTGIDTFFLLANNWQVIAVDKEPSAIQSIHSQIPANGNKPENLNAILCSFEEMRLQPATLINATYSLPFCHPESFPAVWQQIKNSLQPGTRFAGQFFGDEDSWSVRSNMTFHSRKDIDQLFSGFYFDHFEEINEHGKTIKGTVKQWHVYHIVAQKI